MAEKVAVASIAMLLQLLVAPSAAPLLAQRSRGRSASTVGSQSTARQGWTGSIGVGARGCCSFAGIDGDDGAADFVAIVEKGQA